MRDPLPGAAITFLPTSVICTSDADAPAIDANILARHIPFAALPDLSFYGTGIRNRSSLTNVTVTVHRVSLQMTYAGPAPEFAGLDQVNAALPISLLGSGESVVILTVDDQVSNSVSIDIR